MRTFDRDHLEGEARIVADIVYEHVRGVLGSEPGSKGESIFYSPEEWRERGESYGTDSLLVMVHDGGDLAPFCNLDYGAFKLFDGLLDELVSKGYYFEGCTGWYSAVYKA